jgi:hypothetical protein
MRGVVGGASSDGRDAGGQSRCIECTFIAWLTCHTVAIISRITATYRTVVIAARGAILDNLCIGIPACAWIAAIFHTVITRDARTIG